MADLEIDNQRDFFREVVLDENGALKVSGGGSDTTPEQSAEIVINSAKVGITPEQSDAIVLNTDKVGITPEQSDAIVLNTDKVGITPEQSDAIVLNTDKVGITPEQSDAIVLNTDKVGITPDQSAEIVINNTKVGITTDQSDAIDLNTDKVGITTEQVLAVSDNTLVRHSHLNKTVVDKLNEDTGQLTYNGVVVGGGEKGDKGNSFTVTATGSFVESTILSIESSLLYTSENPFIYVVTTDERANKTIPIDLDDLGLHAVLYDGSSWSDMGQFTGERGEKGGKGDTGATGATGADGIQGMQGNSFTVTSSGSLTETIISNAEFSFLYSKQDPFIYVVTTDDRLDKTAPINNSDLSLHAVLYNGDEWADMGEFTGVAGETGEKGEKGDTGFTPAEAEAITDTQMKFLGEYKADSGVSLTLSLPELSMGSVNLETTSGSPEKFYLRYNHDTADDYVIHVDCLHYSGVGEGISEEEGVANETPSYQTGVGRMHNTSSWKRLTPEFSSESYRYARVNFMLLPEYTESSTAGILHAYELLLLTTLSTTDADEVDVIEIYGRKT